MIGMTAAAIAGVTAIGGLGYATAWPRSQIYGPVISRGSAGCGNRVALTFDDGPHTLGTRGVMEALEAEGVVGTFFVIGRFVTQQPDLIRELHARGHLVGNHTFDHHHWGAMRGRRYWSQQLQRTSDVIEETIGKRPTFFRPPMGLKQPHVMRAAQHIGCRVVTWQRRAWDGVPTTTAKIITRIADRARPGDILALHDGVDPFGKRKVGETVAAVRPIVQRLRARGLQPVRLDTLLTETTSGR
ncbi:MAG: polysaccharide deacetylase family protein [Phycisphaeraceae bacterium]